MRCKCFAMALALMISAPVVSPVWAVTIKKPGERKRAPVFELKDGEGKIVRLSDFSGKVVLLDFWATWCAPCKTSIPWLNELANKYQPQGFAVVGIAMDKDGWEVVKPYSEKMRIRYPVLMGNPRVAYLYGDVDSLPLAFFLDRSHRVAAIHLGPASRRAFEKAVRVLLESPE